MLVLSVLGGNLLVASTAAWLFGRWRPCWSRWACAILASALFPVVLVAMIAPPLLLVAWHGQCGQEGCIYVVFAGTLLFLAAALLFGMGLSAAFYLLGQTSHRPSHRHRY